MSKFRPTFSDQELEPRIAPSVSIHQHGSTVVVNVHGNDTQTFATIDQDRLVIDYGTTVTFDATQVKTIVWNVHGNNNYLENDTNVVDSKIHVHGDSNNFNGSLEKDTGFMKGVGNTAFGGGDDYDHIVIRSR